MLASLASRFRRLRTRLGFERDWYLVLWAIVIGLGMGAVASAFIMPLRLIEEWSESADPGLLRWLIPIAPVVGAALAGTIIHLIKAEERGPGVSAVMYSIHRQQATLPARLAPRKWLASTLTIGSGGSAGAEGPIVTIGSVIGSTVGRLLRTTPQNRATLLGCGAAAGISAVFNAPIAGIFFVMEILLRDFSLRTFTPIVIASVVAASWSQGIMQNGGEPIFHIDTAVFAEQQFTLLQLPNFLLLGGVCGVAAALFVRGLFLSESLFGRLKLHPILHPMVGAAALGVLGLLYVVVFRPEHPVPAFYGNGYPEISKWLTPDSYRDANQGLGQAANLLPLLLTVALLKTLATCLTIGSGGAGGLFAPSLLIGATTGGAFGFIVNSLDWFPAADPAAYALVGMGAMVAATTHAPLTGILIVYEITRSYETILPLMLAAVIATIVGRLVYRESVYTVKLTQRGVRLGAMSDLTILRRLTVRDVPLLEGVVVRHDDSAQRLLELSEQWNVTDFIVVDDHQAYCGLVTGNDLKAALVFREAIPLLQVNELLRSDLPTLTLDDPLDVVLDRFAKHDVQSLAVLRGDDTDTVLGLITRSRLMAKYQSVLHED